MNIYRYSQAVELGAAPSRRESGDDALAPPNTTCCEISAVARRCQVELRGATLGAAESRRALASCVPQEFVAHGATRGARTSALCLFTRSFSESSKDRTTRSQGRRAGAGAWGAEAPTGEKKAENVPPHRDYRDARSGRVVMHKVPKALQALQVNELLTREQRLKEARNIEADLHAARRDLDHKSRARFIALYVDVGDVAAARRLVTECTATGKEVC
ncbi:hypothetical protein CYMTET_29244 [Cymbomonas tetramitiformis]|uniref:Uncharacterized protein n=1 Tax=Cymbomonas tetramitiformis TaxID=36881 RepID=A0AAE0KV42_9CHLO|nr:hypothetical protein CYMTET_29244 [Cymbomonas tetramitiformis]